MSHTNIETRNTYEGRVDNITVTNGSANVSIGITPGREYGAGVFTNLTPSEARTLAAALISHAVDVDGHP